MQESSGVYDAILTEIPLWASFGATTNHIEARNDLSLNIYSRKVHHWKRICESVATAQSTSEEFFNNL